MDMACNLQGTAVLSIRLYIVYRLWLLVRMNVIKLALAYGVEKYNIIATDLGFENILYAAILVIKDK